MNNMIKIAAIGVSHWHSIFDSAYLSRLSNFDDVSLIAIQDNSQEILDNRRLQLGSEIQTFTDYTDMLDTISPDLVIALGSHDDMAATANFLVQHNLPFLMEKPMSFSAKELKPLVSKVADADAFATVPLHSRFTKFVSLAKELSITKKYGKLTHFYSRLNRPTSARYPRWGTDWMLDPKRSNGGCLRNLGNHGLDVFCYLTGSGDKVEVTGANFSWGTLNEKVEDYASVMVKNDLGVIGTIETGNCYPGDGTDGEWKAGFENALLLEKENRLLLITSEGTTEIDTGVKDPVLPMLSDVFKNLRSGTNPTVTVEDCYHAVRLIDLAYIHAGNPYGTASI